MSALATRPAKKRQEPGTRTRLFVDVPFTKAPAAKSGDLVLSGYASTFGLDRDGEVVAADAFAKSLPPFLRKNPILLWQHNPDWPIGNATSGLTDDTGLYVTATIPNPGPDSADWQKGAYTAIKNGVVRTFSIGGWMERSVKSGPAGPYVSIDEVDLFEISCVSIPANADSLYEAVTKAISGEGPSLPLKAFAQMEQLLGFKAATDPEVASMGEEERAERYEMLAQLFKGVYGTDPPAYDAWRRVGRAIVSGVSPLKTVEATQLVTRAFYAPQVPREVEVDAPLAKAGRSISAANAQKLKGALDAHDDIADNMVAAAESMKAAAACHQTAVDAIKGVLGMDSEDDAEEGEPADEPAEPNDPRDGAPQKAAGAKQLMSDLYAELRQAGAEKLGPARGWVFLDDYDIDAGQAYFCVVDRDTEEEHVYRVPVLRGQDGSVKLGDEVTEVEIHSEYVPKSLRGEPREKAAGTDPAGEADEGEADGEFVPDESGALMLAQADVQKDLAQAAFLAAKERVGFNAKSALSVADLPVADRDRAWDSGAAKRRVHAWAKQDDGSYDAAKLAQAYLWRDNGASQTAVTSYRFIVADMVGDSLTYIPRGIFASAAVVQGARGGTSEEIAAAVKPALTKLYAKLAAKFEDPELKPPWSGA